MTIWQLTAWLFGAALLTTAIHWLYRGTRKVLDVATLEPFEEQVRPRLRLTRLREVSLWIVRLLLLMSLFPALLLTAEDGPQRDFGDTVVLVVPGTDLSMMPETFQSASMFWLDHELTSLDQAPESSHWPSALVAADRRIPAQSEVTVVGAALGRSWPIQSPVLSRPIRWYGIEGAGAPTDDAWPRTLQLVTDSEPRRQRLEDVVRIWRNAGLLASTEVTWSIEPESQGPMVVWSDTESVVSPFDVQIVGAESDRDRSDATVYPQADWTDYDYAQQIWRALSLFEAQRPVGNVVPGSSVASDAMLRSAGTIQSERINSSGWSVWWTMMILLFGIERLLAARVLRA